MGKVIHDLAGGVCQYGVSYLPNMSFLVLTIARSFLFGYDAGVMTDVIASKNFLAFFHTTSDSDIIGAIKLDLQWRGGLWSPSRRLTMDRFGRKLTILLGALICSRWSHPSMYSSKSCHDSGWSDFSPGGLLGFFPWLFRCTTPSARILRFEGFIVGLSQQNDWYWIYRVRFSCS